MCSGGRLSDFPIILFYKKEGMCNFGSEKVKLTILKLKTFLLSLKE